MILSKIAPTEICTEDLKGRRLPENFESLCLISFHNSITRDERKIVLDCLPDEHPVKGISMPSQAHFPERDSADRASTVASCRTRLAGLLSL